MKDEKYPKDGGDEPSRKPLRRRKTERKKCDKEQTEENKKIQKDEILDEEEDEEKEEEDEYANYSKKETQKIKIYSRPEKAVKIVSKTPTKISLFNSIGETLNLYL